MRYIVHEAVLTFPLSPPAQSKVSSSPGFASATSSAIFAFCPQLTARFVAPFTGEGSSIARIGLGKLETFGMLPR